MPRTLPYADMDKVLSLSKRRGFVFQSSEVYGGLGSTWDYGPLGVELKRNVKEAWWRSVVSERDDVVGLDAAILMHPRVWEASGHVENFSDPLVECRQCHRRFRQDQLETDNCPEPKCGGDFTEPRRFNLMFRTFMGPVEDSSNEVFLRPETAQGIFVNFQNVQTATRKKLPFGIAQIGKAFRNEITPGNFTFRTREFEQMEIEFFVKPGTDDEWLQQWVQARFDWYVSHGIRAGNLRLREHAGDELAHYAKATYDIEYRFPWGWGELEGIANRTDFDLGRHKEFSGEDLTYFDDEIHERYLPYVIEPSGGVDRAPWPSGWTATTKSRTATTPVLSCTSTAPWRRSPLLCCRSAATRAWLPRPAASTTWSVAVSAVSLTTPRASAAATAARTRSAPPTVSPSTSTPWTTTP